MAIAGCSNSSDSADKAGAVDNHNSRDETFSSDMIPHHAQAVEMSNLAETRAVNPEVKRLAVVIKGAQQPEIDQMKSWLEQWGVPYDESQHEGHIMEGMLTAEEMADLRKATGADFDRQFLDKMIRHHQGALDMAEEVIARGTSPDVKTFAETLKKVQAAEIAQMQQMLTRV
jgi:uncharacterized protein (DUF305 family)